jgi:hypothetical protein
LWKENKGSAMSTKKSTLELAQEYENQFCDVSLVYVVRNGAYAVFSTYSDYGGDTKFKMTRKQLLETQVIHTPHGAVEINAESN